MGWNARGIGGLRPRRLARSCGVGGRGALDHRHAGRRRGRYQRARERSRQQRTSSAATARQQALSSATAPPPAGRQPRQRQLPLQGGRVRLPQRSIIETTAGAHTLHINYQTVSGGKHAYDYLTSYNFTETDANACFNRPPCVARTPVAIPIDTAPGGPAAYQADDPQQFIHIWNGRSRRWATSATCTGQLRALADAGLHRDQFDSTGGHRMGCPLCLVHRLGCRARCRFNHRLAVPRRHQPRRRAARSRRRCNKQLFTSAATVPPPPAMTTQVSNASPSVGTAVTDLLTLPSNAAGTATFFICGPAPLTTPASATTGCPTGGNQVGAPVATTGTSATSPPFTPTTGGFYCFRALYTPSGSSPFSSGVHTNATTECFTARRST